jgi:hypothetical protein
MQLSTAEYQTFQDMNELVRDYTAPSEAIVELIDGWYGPSGAPKPGVPVPDLSFVPPGWVGQPEEGLYTDVVATSCRTCHVARAPSQDFNAYKDEFANRNWSVKSLVCDQGKLMPNAKVTFDNFWLSATPHRPAVLAAFSDGRVDTPWTAIGLCK